MQKIEIIFDCSNMKIALGFSDQVCFARFKRLLPISFASIATLRISRARLPLVTGGNFRYECIDHNTAN